MKMRIYFSGEGTKANPEITLGDEATLMLTFLEFHKTLKPSRRFRAVLRARKRGKAKRKARADEESIEST